MIRSAQTRCQEALVGLFCFLRRILSGFTMLNTVLADLDVAPAGAFLLDLVEYIFRDYWIFVSFSSISFYVAVINFPLCFVHRRMRFEDHRSPMVFCNDLIQYLLSTISILEKIVFDRFILSIQN